MVKAPLSLATRYRERFQQPAVADGYVAKVQPSQTTHEQSEPSAVADGSTVKIPFSLATRYRERF